MKHTTPNRTVTRLLALTLATSLATLSACGSDDASEGVGGATSVRVATLPAVTPMILDVAQQEGFFEDNGLDVEITQSTDLGTFIPALGRQYDVVMSTPSDFLAAADRGFDVKALPGAFVAEVDGFDDPGVVSSGAASIEELEGKKIGTNSLTGLQYISLVKSLDDAGVEAELVQVPFPSMVDQLTKGQVDAVAVAEPWRSQLLQDSANKSLFVPPLQALGLDSAPTAWYTTSGEWLGDHEDFTARWEKSMSAAMDWIADPANEDAFRQILVDKLKLAPEQAALVELPAYQLELSSDDLDAYVDLLAGADQFEGGGDDLDTADLIASDG
jgi:NitT/TauT family transport system substrate-binding protein